MDGALVYNSLSQTDRYACATSSQDEGRPLHKRGAVPDHQCILLQAEGSHYFGGAILAIAEDLIAGVS